MCVIDDDVVDGAVRFMCIELAIYMVMRYIIRSASILICFTYVDHQKALEFIRKRECK